MVQAVDQHRLWLPAKYRNLHPSLLKAAEAAEAIDRCITVIEGTLDLEQSRPEYPIYRILCRQDSGRTYNEMVDGQTFATLTTPKIVEPVLTPEEEEHLRRQEEERRLAEIASRRAANWEACQQALLHHTRMMIDLDWMGNLSAPPEPLEFTEELARYHVAFNARNMRGESLQYTAECTVAGGSAKVNLRKR